MINKINLSIIQKIKTLGEIHLIGWKRKQNNKIDQQTQQWLFGKEYFFSHYLQKYKKDTKESARRLNQNEVRVQYKKEITEYLNLYRQITQYLKQFISNYSSVIYDNFQLYNSIDRLFKYHLVAADIEPFINKYKNHDYKIIVTPEQYWRDILKKGINRENISEIIMNPLIHKISPEVKSYIRLKDHFTGWYIKKTIEYKDNFNTLSNIFHSINRYKDIEPFVLCNRINEDYIFKINNSIAYNKMFNFFDITEDLLQRMINATLNEEGRKKEWEEFEKKFRWRWEQLKYISVDNNREYHLEVLGIKKEVSLNEIKKAFRKKTFETHPDIIGGDGKQFIELIQSYDFLIHNQ